MIRIVIALTSVLLLLVSVVLFAGTILIHMAYSSRGGAGSALVGVFVACVFVATLELLSRTIRQRETSSKRSAPIRNIAAVAWHRIPRELIRLLGGPVADAFDLVDTARDVVRERRSARGLSRIAASQVLSAGSVGPAPVVLVLIFIGAIAVFINAATDLPTRGFHPGNGFWAMVAVYAVWLLARPSYRVVRGSRVPT